MTSIFLSSTLVHVIDREFFRACIWMLIAAILCMFGAVHSFVFENNKIANEFGFFPGGLNGWAVQYSAIYLGVALLLFLFHIRENEIHLADLADVLKRITCFKPSASGCNNSTSTPTTRIATTRKSFTDVPSSASAVERFRCDNDDVGRVSVNSV